MRITSFFVLACSLLLMASDCRQTTDPEQDTSSDTLPIVEEDRGLSNQEIAAREGEKTFVARGNEPFWNLDISTNGMVFKEMGQPEIHFPAAQPDILEEGFLYESTTEVEGKTISLQAKIVREDCKDSMSGERFAFTAEVTISGRQLNGCASGP